MAPLIRAVLSKLVGQKDADEIEIIANDVTVFPDGKWEIKFRHPSRCVLGPTEQEQREIGMRPGASISERACNKL